jgi:hypothetical protein
MSKLTDWGTFTLDQTRPGAYELPSSALALWWARRKTEKGDKQMTHSSIYGKAALFAAFLMLTALACVPAHATDVSPSSSELCATSARLQWGEPANEIYTRCMLARGWTLQAMPTPLVIPPSPAPPAVIYVPVPTPAPDALGILGGAIGHGLGYATGDRDLMRLPGGGGGMSCVNERPGGTFGSLGGVTCYPR